MTIQHSPTLIKTATRTAVRLVDLHKSYPHGSQRVHAVRGVSLTLTHASFTAVMGPSGSGKSTLLSCAAGLDVPTRGQVVVGDKDISTLSSDALTRFRRDHVGFIFQAYNLVDHLSVRDNITLPVVLARRTPDAGWLADLVTTLGLSGMEDRLPGELSGGQAQRVELRLYGRTGATRGQLIRMAVVEASFTGGLAWLIGSLAVLPAVFGVAFGLLGATVPPVDWTVYLGLSAAVLLLPQLTVVPTVARLGAR